MLNKYKKMTKLVGKERSPNGLLGLLCRQINTFSFYIAYSTMFEHRVNVILIELWVMLAITLHSNVQFYYGVQ
jgi:hypothetical protein